jgi:SRSO17 transposase
MDVRELRKLRPELDLFLERYLAFFGRSENHQHAQSVVHGLLHGAERRNVENIAEHVKGGVVRTLQKFIACAVWDDRAVVAEIRRHVGEALGEDDGQINVDETGIPKKGKKSVGVARQYAGILGRVDNCQISVVANYCSTKGHTLFDRRLFLPEAWINDRPRCDEAGVPQGVVYRTKPELGLDMLQNAAIAGLPFRWVGGDSLYGDSPTFVQGVRALGKLYVLDSSSDAHVWLQEPTRLEPGPSGPKGGRARRRRGAVEKPIPVPQAAASVPASAWKKFTVAEGTKGTIQYEYVELKVWFSEEGAPAESPERLLIRRSLGQTPDVKYHRSNAPRDVPLEKLARVRARRWTVEEDIQCGKGECGFDEYETRGWIGWHHHTVLSLLSLLFLVLQRQRMEKKKNPR